MTYYDSLDEDLKRAKRILAEGESPKSIRGVHAGCAIYSKDTYAAYKLLESFVEEIERLRTQLASHSAVTKEIAAYIDEVPLPENRTPENLFDRARRVVDYVKQLEADVTKYRAADAAAHIVGGELAALQKDLREFIDDLDCGSFAERHDLDLDAILKVKAELEKLL